MITYHGGPFDGEDHTEEPLAPVVERAVGFLDITPDDVVTPVRRVTVTARYRWDMAERLDFEGVRAEYRVIDL